MNIIVLGLGAMGTAHGDAPGSADLPEGLFYGLRIA